MARGCIRSDCAILAAIAAFHAATGRWPETKDFRACPTLPSDVTIQRKFGTLAEARRLAGAEDGGHEGHGGSGRGPRPAWTPPSRGREKP